MELGINKKIQNVMKSFTDEFIGQLKKSLKIEENNFMDEFKKEGAIYEIDEIGDDEKYVFLTRKEDGKVSQEFDISNELYQEILENSKIMELKYENGKYDIVK